MHSRGQRQPNSNPYRSTGRECVCRPGDNTTAGRWAPLTIVEVLQQALLSGEVQLDLDADGDGEGLARLQGEMGERLLEVPAQELPQQLLCRRR